MLHSSANDKRGRRNLGARADSPSGGQYFLHAWGEKVLAGGVTAGGSASYSMAVEHQWPGETASEAAEIFGDMPAVPCCVSNSIGEVSVTALQPAADVEPKAMPTIDYLIITHTCR